MAIKSNMTNRTPRRQAFKKEVTLLSKGYSAPENWPGGKITVFPWDNEVDNWFLEAAKRQLPRHEILFGLLEKLVDLNGAPLDLFPAEEVNTLLLVARSLGNETVVYNTQCPGCNRKTEETVRIPAELEKIGEKPDTGWPGYDTITLPECKDIAHVRLMLIKDERKIATRSAADRREVSDGDMRILLPILAVNDGPVESLAEIKSWYDALTPKDARHLRDEMRKLAPHLNTILPHKCEECGKEYEHPMAFDDEFFR